MAVTNFLSKLREQHGLSVAALAAATGVTRQTIYAIENGSFVPNTAVALRLARILDTSVDTLFRLDAIPPETTEVILLSQDEDIQPGQPLTLCEVGNRTVALPPSHLPSFLPSSDAVYRGNGRAQIFDHTAGDKILVAGCDPALSVLARHASKAGVNLVLAHRNSTEAIRLLKEGLIHVAGTHLHEKTNPIPRSLQVVSFALWEQGLLFMSNQFNNLRDLTRRGVRFANREPGSGTRAFLDQQLFSLGIEGRQIRGYETVTRGHMAAAWQVKTGAVDCCIATRSAATHFGLQFIPLISERYDFVVHRRSLSSPGIQTLFNVLGDSRFRSEVQALGGYELL